MKVKDLIALLQMQDPEAVVIRSTTFTNGYEDVVEVAVKNDIINNATDEVGTYVIIE
jgi:hypothetical protein